MHEDAHTPHSAVLLFAPNCLSIDYVTVLSSTPLFLILHAHQHTHAHTHILTNFARAHTLAVTTTTTTNTTTTTTNTTTYTTDCRSLVWLLWKTSLRRSLAMRSSTSTTASLTMRSAPRFNHGTGSGLWMAPQVSLATLK